MSINTRSQQQALLSAAPLIAQVATSSLQDATLNNPQPLANPRGSLQEFDERPQILTRTRIEYRATPEENIEAFVSQVRDYIQYNRITDPTSQCAYFRMCLQGEGARWGYENAHINNLDILISKFESYFRSLFRSTTLTHLQLPTFHEDKDLSDHILKFRLAINKVYPPPSEADLVRTFIRTLGYLAPYVVQRPETTLEDAIANARDNYIYKKQKQEYQLIEHAKKRKSKKEHKKPHKKKKAKSQRNDSSSSSDSESKSDKSDSSSESESKSSHRALQRQIKSLQQEVRKSKATSDRRPFNSSYSTRNTRYQPSMRQNQYNGNPQRPTDVQCYICHRVGHTANNCRFRGNNPQPRSGYPAQTNNYPPRYTIPNAPNPAAMQSNNRVNGYPLAKPLGVHAIGVNADAHDKVVTDLTNGNL
jgi:hypothetical protein